MGDRHAHVDFAQRRLAALPQTRVVRMSRVHETDPVGPADQPMYLNAVVHLRTWLPPRVLLTHLLAIEHARGRERAREQRFGPRTLDLDLLLYADWRVTEPGLEVPHPRMAGRAFVMVPLAEVAPDIAAAVHAGVQGGGLH